METVTFKQRVADFWEHFNREEENFRNLMDEKAGTEDLLNAFQEVLNIAFDEIYFNAGFSTTDQKYELILTPEGDRMRYYAIWYWLKQVPEELKDKWTFYASKPAMNDRAFSIDMYGESIGPDSMTIYVEKGEEGNNKINLEICSPVLQKLEENQRFSMFLIFLDLYISELYTMNYIGYVDFITESKEGEIVPLVDLKEYIEAFMQERDLSVSDDPNQGFSVYQLDIEEPEVLREDIFIGNSACMDLINQYYRGETEKTDAAEKNGIVWGFVYYDNSEVPQEEMTGFRGEIEDIYDTIIHQEQMGIHTGGATGRSYSYMDFVVFDLPSFLALTNEIAEKYKLKDCGFSVFKKEGDVIVFTE